jgi:hypothetical protein
MNGDCWMIRVGDGAGVPFPVRATRIMALIISFFNISIPLLGPHGAGRQLTLESLDPLRREKDLGVMMPVVPMIDCAGDPHRGGGPPTEIATIDIEEL